MKLEAVDKKNMALTCVATTVDVLGDRVLIHFDGWEDSYDYWCDPSSPYIHPVGWCQENGKPLSPPNGTFFKKCTGLRPVYTERLRLPHPLTLMMDANAFYIEIYRKTQTFSLGINRPLGSVYLLQSLQGKFLVVIEKDETSC